MNPNEITMPLLLAAYKKQGWPVFEANHKTHNLNLFGVRSANRTANVFDDVLGAFYKDKAGNWVLRKWQATVDPGLHYMKRPMAPGGAAIVAEGYYPGLWELSWFRGTECLRQRTAIRIYRDDNRDEIYDLDPATIQTGHFGILIHEHFQGKTEIAVQVQNSSAGCLVPQSKTAMSELIRLCKAGANNWGNSFSFGLLKQEWL